MMIEVNLLPQELRKVEHTPLPRFMIIIVGTTLVSIALALAAVVQFRKLPDLAKAEAAMDTEMGAATQSQREHDILVGQIEEVRQRKRAIAEIWRARIIWSKKLEQLSQMIPRFIGLDKLKLEESRHSGVGPEVGGYLSLGSVCAGADAERLAMFRRILRGDFPASEASDPWIGRTWFTDFASIDATPWSRKDVNDYEEKETLNFTLNLAIKPDDQRLREYLDSERQAAAAKAKSARVDKTRPVGPAPQGTVVPAAASEAKPASGDAPTIVNTSGRASQ